MPAARSSTFSPGCRSQRLAGARAPAAVLARRQHGVGDVVAAGDAVEHRGDVAGVLVQVGAAHPANATRARQHPRPHPTDRTETRSMRSRGAQLGARFASIPPTDSGQPNRSARARAAARRAPSSAASRVVTPAAKAAGESAAAAPDRSDDLRQRRRGRTPPRASRWPAPPARRARTSRAVRARARRRPRRAAWPAAARSGTKPRNVTGRPAARRSRAGPPGPVARHHEPDAVPGRRAARRRCRCCAPGASPARAVHSGRAGCPAPRPARRAARGRGAAARTSRGRRRAGPGATLRAPIRSNSARANDGRAHDGVVGRRHPGVGRVGHAARGAARAAGTARAAGPAARGR